LHLKAVLVSYHAPAPTADIAVAAATDAYFDFFVRCDAL
jgi:hypothetical protein